MPAGWRNAKPSFCSCPRHFHVVFTLPAQIGRLALQNPKQIYSILFRTAAAALLETAADPRLLGAHIGFLAVLHTWGQNLHLHPHLHCVVPGGGISLDGSRWIGCRKSSFFLPVRVLSHRFRKSFLRSLRRAFRKGALRFHGELKSLSEPAAFSALCDQATAVDWVVHVKPPFGGPRRVLKYLARYTHRRAPSPTNGYRKALENGRVSFEWKDYARRSQNKLMTLDAVEFLRRLLLHIDAAHWAGAVYPPVRLPRQSCPQIQTGTVPPPLLLGVRFPAAHPDCGSE